MAAASSASLTAPGSSVITAFMLLRWSAATISMRQAAVEIAVMPRRSRVVSGFMVPPEWVGVGGSRRAATRAAPNAVSCRRAETDTSGRIAARARRTLAMAAQPPVSVADVAGGTSASMASTSSAISSLLCRSTAAKTSAGLTSSVRTVEREHAVVVPRAARPRSPPAGSVPSWGIAITAASSRSRPSRSRMPNSLQGAAQQQAGLQARRRARACPARRGAPS